MDQKKVIADLTGWLEAEFGSESLRFRCAHATENRQELAFFLERKEPGTGRGARIAQADIIGCRPDKKTVELVVEVGEVVDPSPKKVISNIVPYFFAANYTPSYELMPYEMVQTVLFFPDACQWEGKLSEAAPISTHQNPTPKPAQRNQQRNSSDRDLLRTHRGRDGRCFQEYNWKVFRG